MNARESLSPDGPGISHVVMLAHELGKRRVEVVWHREPFESGDHFAVNEIERSAVNGRRLVRSWLYRTLSDASSCFGDIVYAAGAA